MKRRGAALVCALVLLFAVSARAVPEADTLIAVSFRMLEEDNPFVARFEARSGQDVDIMFPQGMPYLFGNPYSRYTVFNNYPDYVLMRAPATSGYFRKGELYFYGTDCSGFIRYINRDSGKAFQPDTLSNMLFEWKYRMYHVFGTQTDTEIPPIREQKDILQVGDYLILRRQGARYMHIGMYIGTMRDFGYTEEEEPELAPYLDYPLVIHCGLSPVYGERFQELIDTYPEKYGRVTTTDGGVQVSVVGADPDAVPEHRHVQNTDYDYFVMRDGNYVLTNISLENLVGYCWFRQPY